MGTRTLYDFMYMLVFVGVGVAFLFLILTLPRLLAPRQPSEEKLSIYECGNIPIGEPWIQFRIQYYLFALLFLIFDVEVALLYPWAVVFRRLSVVAFIEVLIFIAVLVLGLIYAWRKGALKWV